MHTKDKGQRVLEHVSLRLALVFVILYTLLLSNAALLTLSKLLRQELISFNT